MAAASQAPARLPLPRGAPGGRASPALWPACPSGRSVSARAAAVPTSSSPSGAARSARRASRPTARRSSTAAAWDGKPARDLLDARREPGVALARAAGADLLSISSSGEMALADPQPLVGLFARAGTLARVPLDGRRAPREILEDVQDADWAPDGSELAVVRESGRAAGSSIPIGKVLYETAGWISHPRVSPDGRSDRLPRPPVPGDDGGTVAVVDRRRQEDDAGAATWAQREGPGLVAGRNEIWFTAAEAGGNRELSAVTLSGKERLLARGPGNADAPRRRRGTGASCSSHDYAARRRSSASRRARPGAGTLLARLVLAPDISPDGRSVLFDENGEGAAQATPSIVRETDGSPRCAWARATPGVLARRQVGAGQRSAPNRRSSCLLPTGPGSRAFPRRETG